MLTHLAQPCVKLGDSTLDRGEALRETEIARAEPGQAEQMVGYVVEGLERPQLVDVGRVLAALPPADGGGLHVDAERPQLLGRRDQRPPPGIAQGA